MHCWRGFLTEPGSIEPFRGLVLACAGQLVGVRRGLSWPAGGAFRCLVAFRCLRIAWRLPGEPWAVLREGGEAFRDVGGKWNTWNTWNTCSIWTLVCARVAVDKREVFQVFQLGLSRRIEHGAPRIH